MISIKVLINFIFALALISFITACGSSKKLNRDYLYFQRGLDSLGAVQLKENVIKANDVLTIQISSKSSNQDQVALFNIPGAASSGYPVNSAGNIDLPVIGSIKAAGLTKVQLQSLLIQKLSPYVKDPSVIIKFQQFNVNVLGEVRSPGTKTFQADKVTIIDAISTSGDFTDFGKKENVMVIREENEQRKYYRVDMRSGSLFQSPVYLLQPNDIVFVEANDFRLKALNTDPKKVDKTRTWLTFSSLLITITSLILTITRY